MGVRTADEAWASARIDPAKLEATTESEIEGYMIAEGEDPDAPLHGYRLLTPDRTTSPPRRPKRGSEPEIAPPKKSA